MPCVGLAAIVVVASWLTFHDATAELATPAVVALAMLGLAVGLRRRVPRRWGWQWPAGAALTVFVVYAAPIVLSGEATFAGYIRLDDTATWMALTDHVMDHGRSLDDLAPSTYEAALAFNLGDGYPVGALLPLGVGRELVGTDAAWLIQPYMAWLGAVLALGLWALSGPVVGSPVPRAAIAVIAAQPALLYGYYLWGGVKEMAATTLIAAAATALGTPRTVTDDYRGPKAVRHSSARAWIPLVLVGAAIISALSAAAAVWLVGPLVALGAVTAAGGGRRRGLLAVTAVVAAGAVLSLPVLLAGGFLPPTSSPLTDSDASGNLIGPLSPAQVAGIWPAGDFRLDPAGEPITYALIVLTVIAALAGIAIASRRGAWQAVAYAGGAIASALLIYAFGSPWVDAKALAIASPAVLVVAGVGAAVLLHDWRRAPGMALLAAIGVGVVWSNALAYRDANLAPRDQLAELERIGPLIAGEGPTLVTEYQPYGARHFLRAADAEAASELRRRRIALTSGGTLAKGESADTDRIDPAALAAYRTLVLRRSPAQSRPPAGYRPVWRGHFYEVWQRSRAGGPVHRLALGGARDPSATPACARVLALAREAEGGSLAAARRPSPIPAAARLEHPGGWVATGSGRLLPDGPGTLAATVAAPAAARYSVWLGGSVRSSAEVRVDGQRAGEVRHLLNNEGQYAELGSAWLERGHHRIEVALAGADLHPGSGGASGAIGPLVLSRADPAESTIVRLPAAEAERLCGRAWDWIEVEP